MMVFPPLLFNVSDRAFWMTTDEFLMNNGDVDVDGARECRKGHAQDGEGEPRL